MTENFPPRIYYGWIILPLSMLSLFATSVGQTYCISSFNKEIGASLLMSETELAKAYMLGTVLGAIPISYFGHLMDRFGLRKTLLGTTWLLTGACFALAYAHGWWALVGAYCLLRMLGPGVLAMLSGNTLAFWFHERLGSVEAIRKLSLSFAMGAVPAINHWILLQMNWRQAYSLWGGAIWLTMFPLCWLFFRNRPEDVGQPFERKVAAPEDKHQSLHLTGMTVEQAVRTSAFWALTLGAGLFALIMTAIVFHRISIMEQHGLTAADSAVMMAVLSATFAVTQFFSGNLSDRYPAKPLICIGLAAFGVGVLCLSIATSPFLVVVSGLILGVAQGFYSGASHPLWARHFGRLHLGKITGIWMTLMVAASASGPYFAGLLRDFTGTYTASLLIFAALPITAILLTLIADLGDRKSLEEA